jgi:hypothetical protein
LSTKSSVKQFVPLDWEQLRILGGEGRGEAAKYQDALSSLARAALAKHAVGLRARLFALAGPLVALVLQQAFNKCDTPSTKSSVKP